ncbi:hypothetical protein P43SY_009179 [Pythium insidiosum]|uniref:Centrosomal protein of 19 kDa n=1 Tax=Pythium insidiosum TaxID=114742 RepID=A0AAD5LNU1_PYTIN|nr:hypothetical protein P43SY_009179 [Pythium insidiosum]
MVEPRRLALRYAPPAIIVEYARYAQLYHRAIDLRPFLLTGGVTVIADHDVRRIVERISKENEPVLENIASRQRLVRKLLERDVAVGRLTSADKPKEHIYETAAIALPQADYNRVSETQLRQVKERMDVVFQKNIVRPGDAGYQYDKQVSFRVAQEASDWDDD